MNEPNNDLDQKIINLEQSVRQEKLKKAEEVFTLRLVYTTIIFVIIFIILMTKLDDASAGVQWLFIIIFFAIALITAGRIFNTYTCERDDAMK